MSIVTASDVREKYMSTLILETIFQPIQWNQKIRSYDFSPMCSTCFNTIGLSSHAFAVKQRTLPCQSITKSLRTPKDYNSSPCLTWVPTFLATATSTTAIQTRINRDKRQSQERTRLVQFLEHVEIGSTLQDMAGYLSLWILSLTLCLQVPPCKGEYDHQQHWDKGLFWRRPGWVETLCQRSFLSSLLRIVYQDDSGVYCKSGENLAIVGRSDLQPTAFSDVLRLLSHSLKVDIRSCKSFKTNAYSSAVEIVSSWQKISR